MVASPCFFRFLPQLLHFLENFRQTAEKRGCAQPAPVVHPGGAAQNLAGRNISMESGLSRRDHAISYVAMSRDAHLAGQDDVLAHMGGSGETDLGTEQGIFSHARTVPH